MHRSCFRRHRACVTKRRGRWFPGSLSGRAHGDKHSAQLSCSLVWPPCRERLCARFCSSRSPLFSFISGDVSFGRLCWLRAGSALVAAPALPEWGNSARPSSSGCGRGSGFLAQIGTLAAIFSGGGVLSAHGFSGGVAGWRWNGVSPSRPIWRLVRTFLARGWTASLWLPTAVLGAESVGVVCAGIPGARLELHARQAARLPIVVSDLVGRSARA